MTTFTDRKLGKRTPSHDRRTLALANYLRLDQLPSIPASVDWSKKVAPPWGMMDNDSIGDCTCAAAGHLIMEWTANAGREIVPPDAAILKAYEDVSGYDPATGQNDNGAVETDVLNYWRNVGIAGHKINAYMSLEPKNHAHVKAATYIFGGCYIGLNLPLSAQSQSVWDVPAGGAHGDGEPGSWGGHAVPIVAYDEASLTVVTWGSLMQMTWGFLDAYCDEAYALLSLDFLIKNQAPNGINLQMLQADLKAIAG